MTSPEILIPDTKKAVIFDATLLSSLQGCPTYLDLRFNHNFESLNGTSNSLECGSLVHKILEVFYLHIVDGMKREQAIGHAMTAGQLYITGCPYCTNFEATETTPKPPCGHKLNEYPSLKNTPPDSQKKPKRTGWKWVLETMDQYFAYYINDVWKPLEVERVMGKMLYEDDDIKIYWKAKMDLTVQTNVPDPYPVDHKTMSQDRDNSKMHNQFIGQCFLMGTRSMIVNKIGFQTSKKPDEKFKRVMWSYTADNILEWQSQTVPYWAYQLLAFQEAGYYPHRWTNCENKYGQCQYIDVCGADRNMREEILRLNFKVGEPWDPQNG